MNSLNWMLLGYSVVLFGVIGAVILLLSSETGEPPLGRLVLDWLGFLPDDSRGR